MRCLPSPLRIWFALAAWFTLAGLARPADAPRWEVIAECHMVALPQKTALPLIADLSDDAKIDAAFANLEQMIGRGEATMTGNLLLRGVIDEELTSESVEEVKYPTEWDPPQLPYPVPKEKALDVLKAWPMSITPTAFEKRGVGPSLIMKTTSVSDDGRWIACFAQVQHVRFLRYHKYDAGIMPSGERFGIELPIFSTLKSLISLRVRSGQRLLAGIHKVPKEDTMELFFLRIRAQPQPGAP